MSKLVVLLMLIAVLASLGLALYYLVYDRGTTERTVRALTWRTLLSVILFVVLLSAAAIGLIGPREPLQTESSVQRPPARSTE